MTTPRVALLVDGDNISAKHAETLQQSAAALGRVDVARVYGSGATNGDWPTLPGFRFIFAGEGKNAADLLLSIDAVELALRGGMDVFVLASNDSDFSHLAHRLREMGLHVLGIGAPHASLQFQAACSSFDVLLPGTPCAASQIPQQCMVSEFDEKIRRVIVLYGKPGKGMLISKLGQEMHREHHAKISSRPERTWWKYLSDRPLLFDVDPRGPQAMVRYKPKGFRLT